MCLQNYIIIFILQTFLTQFFHLFFHKQLYLKLQPNTHLKLYYTRRARIPH